LSGISREFTEGVELVFHVKNDGKLLLFCRNVSPTFIQFPVKNKYESLAK